MRVLILDIETAPNLAFVWGLFKQNITLDKIVDSSYTLCWAAKWLDSPEIMYDSIYKSSEKKMLKGIHKLLSEADVVVSHNGRNFDLPTLNKDFLLHKMPPPAPYKQVDTLEVSRGTFRFQSHKLDYISKSLGHGGKIKHAGFQLWVDCMAGKPEAWESMERYNKGDVIQLEKVYMDFRPWIKNHPNVGLYNETVACPRCGETDKLHKRGTATTISGKYQRYQCQCGGWARGTKKLSAAKITLVGV